MISALAPIDNSLPMPTTVRGFRGHFHMRHGTSFAGIHDESRRPGAGAPVGRYAGGMSPLPVVEPEVMEEARVRAQRLWCTVVHDDPVNTMSYVTWVFHSYFGLPIPVARARMLEVHTAGRAVVSRGSRERMEVDVSAMHGYGLRATIEPLAGGQEQDDGHDPSGGAA
ncbi:hypothetical protein ACSL103130_00920 [Actinomyces slackii]